MYTHTLKYIDQHQTWFGWRVAAELPRCISCSLSPVEYERNGDESIASTWTGGLKL